MVAAPEDLLDPGYLAWQFVSIAILAVITFYVTRIAVPKYLARTDLDAKQKRRGAYVILVVMIMLLVLLVQYMILITIRTFK